MSYCSDIEVVQKVLEQYEKVIGPKINHNKSPSLQLDAWKEAIFPGLFSWTDGPICILRVWFEEELV